MLNSKAWFSYSMEDRRPKKKGGTLKEKLRKGALNLIQKRKKKPETSGKNYYCFVI